MVTAKERKRLDAIDAKKRNATAQMFKDRARKFSQHKPEPMGLETDKTYICMSGKELSEEEMREVAVDIGCRIGFVAQVIGEQRWDYRIDRKILTPEDRKKLSRYGLEIIIE